MESPSTSSSRRAAATRPTPLKPRTPPSSGEPIVDPAPPVEDCANGVGYSAAVRYDPITGPGSPEGHLIDDPTCLSGASRDPAVKMCKVSSACPQGQVCGLCPSRCPHGCYDVKPLQTVGICKP
jgi:hypothetical protein